MTRMIFVSLPVADLDASTRFYRALGFERNPRFSDETAACMVWSEHICAMVLTHARWHGFTQRPIPPATSSEAMFALTLDTREAVDAMNTAAQAHGGARDVNPEQDLGFMYSRSFTDPDGHVWEAIWMHPDGPPAN